MTGDDVTPSTSGTMMTQQGQAWLGFPKGWVSGRWEGSKGKEKGMRKVKGEADPGADQEDRRATQEET